MFLNYLHKMMAVPRAASSCEPADPSNTVTTRLNTLLNSSGSGYVLSLCPSTQYFIDAPILFTSPNQEISTFGYPTDNTRAVLVVNGAVSNGTGQTTAVDGTCANCDGVKLRNVQINGTRAGAPPINGGANIEMGGSNSGQLIEYVHSWDPRSWSCLHISEGALNCTNVTVQNNDVGPAGSDLFQQWADGISVACTNSIVRNNMINNPTDGGIVLFGSPGTLVENNTIWVENNTLLGGINMVDVVPFSGDYKGVVVTNNTIMGGFATNPDTGSAIDGTNNQDVIIKIGIAIGPRTWFGNEYLNNVSTGGTVLNNQLTGAFSYGIAISSATNFTVENNVLIGNTSFIGARGPNCTTGDPTPSPAPFVIDINNTAQSTTQSNFSANTDGDALTCVLPPDGGDYWPFGGNPSTSPSSPPSSSSSPSKSSQSSTGKIVGIVVGVVGGMLLIALAAWYIRKWALKRAEDRAHYKDTRHVQKGYTRSKEQF
jgi:parallel beta-helix repeat protein